MTFTNFLLTDGTEEDLDTSSVYGQFNQIPLPDGMCGDHQMYNAVQDVFNKLRNFRYNEFEFLAYVFEDIGVNISSSVELKRLACYMSGMRLTTNYTVITVTFLGKNRKVIACTKQMQQSEKIVI